MITSPTYISTATIHFYENLYQFPSSDKYVWIIKLEDCPLFSASNRIYVDLHSSYEISSKIVTAIRHYFALNHIVEGSKISVISDNENIIALGTNGADNYLDVRVHFKAKTFSELGINITSLVVANY